jgi:hypothetical protein
MPTLESRLQSLLLLRAPGRIPQMRLFRRNVAKVRVQNRKLTFGIKGQCDIYAIIRGGRHLEIELKATKGKLSEEQIAWANWCYENLVPHTVLFARSEETPEKTVERWLDELIFLVLH